MRFYPFLIENVGNIEFKAGDLHIKLFSGCKIDHDKGSTHRAHRGSNQASRLIGVGLPRTQYWFFPNYACAIDVLGSVDSFLDFPVSWQELDYIFTLIFNCDKIEEGMVGYVFFKKATLEFCFDRNFDPSCNLLYHSWLFNQIED